MREEREETRQLTKAGRLRELVAWPFLGNLLLMIAVPRLHSWTHADSIQGLEG
jgi:hypothetical protein